MLVKTAEFIKSATRPSQYPPPVYPEVAFAGRSNVGKSSLINTLVNRKRLVKTSSTPGRTQLINYFLINDVVYFVDLPGYGYAKAPPSVRKKWGPMVESYLTGRPTLRGVVLIMDIRRIPGSEELNFIDWLMACRISCILAITKSDKLSKSKQIKRLSAISETLETDVSSLFPVSSKSRAGIPALWESIDQLTKVQSD